MTKKLEAWQKVGIIMLIVIIGGFFGWVYEFIFYFFDGDMKEFYMQGGNFLPWINIYAIGSLLILLATWRFKKYPWLVFLLSIIITGLLEFSAGWLIYTIGNGTRYWDCNNEILNFGNIEGFVYLRSVLVFGISALFLVYIITPFCIKLSQRMSKKAFLTLAITLFTIVMLDEIGNLTCKILSLPTAVDFYRSIGFKYH